MAHLPFAMQMIGAAAVLGAFVAVESPGRSEYPHILTGSSCTIKGNISVTTGERIYHVPGQKYYDETVIAPDRGERWFCSESDARAAGWRRSKV